MDYKNGGIDNNLFNYIISAIQGSPFYKLLGIDIKELGPGFTELILEPSKEHTNPLGAIHGGLIMTIADAAMGNAVRTLKINAVTVDCSVSLISAAPFDQTIRARGKVLKAGKNLIFAKSSVYSGEKLIADSKATFFKTGDIQL